MTAPVWSQEASGRQGSVAPPHPANGLQFKYLNFAATSPPANLHHTADLYTVQYSVPCVQCVQCVQCTHCTVYSSTLHSTELYCTLLNSTILYTNMHCNLLCYILLYFPLLHCTPLICTIGTRAVHCKTQHSQYLCEK